MWEASDWKSECDEKADRVAADEDEAEDGGRQAGKAADEEAEESGDEWPTLAARGSDTPVRLDGDEAEEAEDVDCTDEAGQA